jgi:hypothetical protein
VVDSLSNSVQVVVKCSDEACSWKAKFSKGRRDDSFRCNWSETEIQHSDTCMVLYHNRGLSARAIAASPRFKAIVKCNHKSPTKAISAAVNEHLGLRISDRTLQRARNLVVGNEAASAAEDLANSGPLLKAFKMLNPGAVVNLEVDTDDVLVHWFVAFDNSSLIHGGLLPVLFCDGAHTKNAVCKRFILVISALNTERQLVILAIACVKNESTETWTYMFTMFSKTPLGHLALLGRLTLMSDRDGGLRAAATAVLPLAMQRNCILHVIKNAKKAGIRADYRLLVKMSKTGSLVERDRLWLELQRSSPNLAHWLTQSVHDFQIQAAPVVAQGIAICGCVTNNPAESANSMLLRKFSDSMQSLREMTPGPMLREAIKVFANQANKFREHSRNHHSTFPSRFTINAVKSFVREQNQSRFYEVHQRGIRSYLVVRRGSSAEARHVYQDEQNLWGCDCGHMQQYKILCRHILAAIASICEKECRKLLKRGGIGGMWSLADYERAFGSLEVRAPSAAEEFACVNQIDFPRRVLIPAQVAQRGRPKKIRIKSFDERIRAQARAAGTSSVMCGICGVLGHNMRSCNIIHRPCMEED